MVVALTPACRLLPRVHVQVADLALWREDLDAVVAFILLRPWSHGQNPSAARVAPRALCCGVGAGAITLVPGLDMPARHEEQSQGNEEEGALHCGLILGPAARSMRAATARTTLPPRRSRGARYHPPFQMRVMPPPYVG